MSANLSAIFYLVSGVLFILALRGLSSPETSRQGNFFASRRTYWSVHSLQDTNDGYARVSSWIS